MMDKDRYRKSYEQGRIRGHKTQFIVPQGQQARLSGQPTTQHQKALPE